MRRAVAGLVLLLCALPPTVLAATSYARHGATWIASQEGSDGSFADPPTTGSAIAAMVAGGVTGTKVSKALAYLKNHGRSAATEGRNTGEIIAGIVAGGQDPRSFGGQNYVAILDSQRDSTTGAYDTKDLISDLLAVNGANAAKDPVPSDAIAYIDGRQCPDGGFSTTDCSDGSDVLATSWAINVLIAAGHKSDPAVATARRYLLDVQRPDGGFYFSSNNDVTNADATGVALAAIKALGESPTKAPWSDGTHDPVKALVALQTSNGSFRIDKNASSGNLTSTIDAVPGLAPRTYPIRPARTPTQPTPPPTLPPKATTTEQPRSGTGSSDTRSDHASPTAGERTSPRNATDTATQAAGSQQEKAGVQRTPAPTITAVAAPSPSVLGFGGITTKRGGLSIAAWIAIAVGTAGLGVGGWFLRAYLR
jgi:hypothetical protein